MESLAVLVLLSSAVLLCAAAPALEPVTCSEDDSAAAARLAVHHINEHHNHGYKFQLSEVQGTKVDKREEDCDVELQLKLLETWCHVVNPRHYEECRLRGEFSQEVMANCTVMMTVDVVGAKVKEYKCDTRTVKNSQELLAICPDCPILLPLNNAQGLSSVHKAVKTFNQNTTNLHYYILREVGRIQSGYTRPSGKFSQAEFVLVETHCPMGSRIVPEACKPLCPDRAHHAFCKSFYPEDNEYIGKTECEFYSPVNTIALGPGEREPVCRPPHAHGHWPLLHAGAGGPPPHAHGHGPPLHAGAGGPPPHAHGHGPPLHAGAGGPPPYAHGHGPPPHSGGPPPHAQGRRPPPHAGDGGPPPHAQGHRPPPHAGIPPPHHVCRGNLVDIDPKVHPICPWPLPERHPEPRQIPS